MESSTRRAVLEAEVILLWSLICFRGSLRTSGTRPWEKRFGVTTYVLHIVNIGLLAIYPMDSPMYYK